MLSRKISLLFGPRKEMFSTLSQSSSMIWFLSGPPALCYLKIKTIETKLRILLNIPKKSSPITEGHMRGEKSYL